MENTITLRLSPRLAAAAETAARQTRRTVEAVLVDWLDRMADDVPVDWLDDAQLLSLTQANLSQEQQERLADLLAEQREGELSDAQCRELDWLMLTYRRGLVRKAQALKLAVERGLHSPLG